MKVESINGITTRNYNPSKAQKTENISRNYTNNTELKNIYYTPLNFTRRWSEHKSWGANIDPKTKNVTFKLFSYPDNQSVEVEVKNKKTGMTYVFPMEKTKDGIYESEPISPRYAKNGDSYSYIITKADGTTDKVKDPYSFCQKTLLGESVLYDNSLFKWNDEDWFKRNKKRVSRLANHKNHLTSVNNLRIYEFNTKTLTQEGTFEGAQKELERIKKLGFNAIEIMPVEATYSFNWGYDGVDKMAPAEHLGGPDNLKSFVDFAHSQGLNVIMDMVPNHLGPDGASLKKTGPFIKGNNCFGESFNFEGENSKYVKDYMVNAALNWIENYHCDGLRLDMTKFMESDSAMKQIAAEVNYHKPDAFLIAEDGRSAVSANDDGFYWENQDEPHDKRVLNPLKPEEYGEGKNERVHNNAIEEISQGNGSLGRLGFDSEWDFNYFHTLKDALYGIINMDEFEKSCYCSQDRVKYVMSHDEIGNFEGTRLLAKLMVPMLHLNDNMVLNQEELNRAEALKHMKGMSDNEAYWTVTVQKAQFTAEKLAIMLQEGKLDKYDISKIHSRALVHAAENAFKTEVLRPLGLNENAGISYENLKYMYNRSFNKNKMAMARTFSLPGPKMVFQGDERADLTPFRFFRQFDSVKYEDYLYTEKGYKPGKPALKESKFGNIKYSENAVHYMRNFRTLIKDLNKLNDDNPALTTGRLIPDDTVKHHSSQVFATHSSDGENNDIYTVTNFSSSSYPRRNAADYYIKFPKGEWVEVLNTDDRKYGGTGEYMNKHIIKSDGISNLPIKLSSESTLIFKKIK